MVKSYGRGGLAAWQSNPPINHFECIWRNSLRSFHLALKVNGRLPLLKLNSIFSFRRYDRALVIDDLPSSGRAPPEGGSTSDTSALMQGVREQVIVSSDLLAAEILGLPMVFMGFGVAMQYGINDELPAVAATRGPDLPERFVRHGFKRFAAGAMLGAMKDWFPLGQLVLNGDQVRKSFQLGFHRDSSKIVLSTQASYETPNDQAQTRRRVSGDVGWSALLGAKLFIHVIHANWLQVR